MSFSEMGAGEASDSVPTAAGRPPEGSECPAATRAGETVASAIQRFCPTRDELRENTERLRGSIREQPLMAVLIALGVGVMIASLAGSHGRATGARQ